MNYLSRDEFSTWLAATTPANVFSAAAFFLAFNAPEDEQADRLGEIQAVALNDHRLPLEEFRQALDMACVWDKDWPAVIDTVADQLGFAPLEPFDEDKPDALPPFPVEALPPVLRDYALAVAESLQAPVDMAAVGLLAVCALAAQGAWKIEVKPDWVEPLNLYALIIAPPSERKSPVLREIARPVYAFEADEQARREQPIREYQAQRSILEKRLAAAIDAAAKPAKGKSPAAQADGLCAEQEVYNIQQELAGLQEVKPFRLLADDVTPEALTSLLATYGGQLGVFSAEGGLFKVLAGLYSGHSANFDGFLKAYSGDPVRVDRKGRPSETIQDPALTLLLMAQPQVLAEIAGNAEFGGRGLLARFLYCLPVSRVGTRAYRTTPIPADVRDAFDQALAPLLENQASHTGPAQIIRLSDEADALSEAFALRLEPRLHGDLADIEGWAGKYHGQVARIAGVLHCFENGPDAGAELLTGGTFQAAATIGAYFLAHAQAALTRAGLTKTPLRRDAEYIWQKLQASGKVRFSKKEVLQLCQRLGAESMRPPLEELARRGYIKLERLKRDGQRGRPSETVTISPAALLKAGEE